MRAAQMAARSETLASTPISGPSWLWYAGYGSNIDEDRFTCYLTGGRPPGARRENPGARDPSPPQAQRPVVLPGQMFFGWESATWGGGVAFLDARAEGTALARAYLITGEQFADVAAQEMHRTPGDPDLAPLELAQSWRTAPTPPARGGTRRSIWSVSSTVSRC